VRHFESAAIANGEFCNRGDGYSKTNDTRTLAACLTRLMAIGVELGSNDKHLSRGRP